ncbi:MAG: hypothetical protein IPP98_12915 [Gemmatimonadetes bacterium]|nr:hypothetical protein [Gemmatimonadota bacterium]
MQETYDPDGADVAYTEWPARTEALRVEALAEIHAEQGILGILQLATRGETSEVIGELLIKAVVPPAGHLELVGELIAEMIKGELPESGRVLAGVLGELEVKGEVNSYLETASQGLLAEEQVRVFQAAPFQQSTWQMVDAAGLTERYWGNVEPRWIRGDVERSRIAAEGLLAAHRPRAAFAAVSLLIDQLEPQLLARLLRGIVESNGEQGRYRVESHDIERAFEVIEPAPEMSVEEKAALELLHLETLSGAGRGRGISHLEKYLSLHPEFFAEVVSWVYRRDDRASEASVDQLSEKQRESRGNIGYSLLSAINRVPGVEKADDEGDEHLAKWVRAARESNSQLGRRDVGDHCIGVLLCQVCNRS